MTGPCWDDRTETVIVECIGGPLDGATCPVPPGVRTVRNPTWAGYYEVMWWQRGTPRFALVWHTDAPSASPFWLTGAEP